MKRVIEARQVVLLLASLSVASTSIAMEAPAAQLPNADVTVSTPIEEIEVTGQRTVYSLVYAIEQAEVQMFSLFNELNSSDDFDVTCGHITYTGTRIASWVCDSGFLKKERELDMQRLRMRAGFEQPRTEAQLRFDTESKARRLNAEMKALALQHPELARRMLDLAAKQEALEAANRKLRSADED
jgi:hypothetical protein